MVVTTPASQRSAVVLLQQAHVSFVVPHHLQGALHSTVRLHALPEGRRCEGEGPFARPGLCEGQAWWWGVTGVGSAGVQMQEHEGSHSVLSHASSGRQSFISIVLWCGFRPRTAPCHRRAAFVAFWTYPRPLYNISSSVTYLARTLLSMSKPLCIRS